MSLHKQPTSGCASGGEVGDTKAVFAGSFGPRASAGAEILSPLAAPRRDMAGSYALLRPSGTALMSA
jgi:hypothetical protein